MLKWALLAVSQRVVAINILVDIDDMIIVLVRNSSCTAGCKWFISLCVFQGMRLTPFEEEQLTKKWQEILGPSNEIIVSLFFRQIIFKEQ